MSQWDFGYGREPTEHHEPQYPQQAPPVPGQPGAEYPTSRTPVRVPAGTAVPVPGRDRPDRSIGTRRQPPVPVRARTADRPYPYGRRPEPGPTRTRLADAATQADWARPRRADVAGRCRWPSTPAVASPMTRTAAVPDHLRARRVRGPRLPAGRAPAGLTPPYTPWPTPPSRATVSNRPNRAPNRWRPPPPVGDPGTEDTTQAWYPGQRRATQTSAVRRARRRGRGPASGAYRSRGAVDGLAPGGGPWPGATRGNQGRRPARARPAAG